MEAADLGVDDLPAVATGDACATLAELAGRVDLSDPAAIDKATLRRLEVIGFDADASDLDDLALAGAHLGVVLEGHAAGDATAAEVVDAVAGVAEVCDG